MFVSILCFVAFFALDHRLTRRSLATIDLAQGIVRGAIAACPAPGPECV